MRDLKCTGAARSIYILLLYDSVKEWWGHEVSGVGWKREGCVLYCNMWMCICRTAWTDEGLDGTKCQGSEGVKCCCFNPFPTLIILEMIRIFGTVASSPRAVTGRLLFGCVWARYG